MSPLVPSYHQVQQHPFLNALDPMGWPNKRLRTSYANSAAAAEPSRRSCVAVPSLRHADAASGGQRAAPEIDDCATARRGKGGADASPLPSVSCHIDRLPDELVATILRDVFKKAQSLSDIASLLLTCRRFYDICRPASHWSLLASASVEALLPTDAAHWTPAVQRFLLSAATEGNIEAIYIAGMISFYCIGNHWAGARLLAQAAECGHGPATYSLAIINFHGSGGTARDTNPQAGVDLCWRAAKLGFMPALQELGHCFVDGYGVSQRISLGKLLLQHASAAMEGTTSTCPQPAARWNAYLSVGMEEEGAEMLQRGGGLDRVVRRLQQRETTEKSTEQQDEPRSPPQQEQQQSRHGNLHLDLNQAVEPAEDGREGTASAGRDLNQPCLNLLVAPPRDTLYELFGGERPAGWSIEEDEEEEDGEDEEEGEEEESAEEEEPRVSPPFAAPSHPLFSRHLACHPTAPCRPPLLR
ncbi:unnamed protein product [Closterium sp. NIES-65]|nr:unnamed protein product [Closterium sp. NIES-65]